MMVLAGFDTVMTKLIGKIPRRFHPFFDVLGYLTMPVVWFTIVAGVIMYQSLTDHPIATGLVILACIPVATVLKLFIRRHRPMTIYAEAMKVKSYSFPSSHAYAGALVGGYFAYLSFTSGYTVLSSVFVVLAVLIGISRVHLGAHYPSDVVAGWLLGASALFIALQV